ncbi:MAG TPA: hypothetical protein VFJ74_15100, partial [Gemmatimonadaceae bacterium]|nr:hypothetical protein [Gemmatimonadaceae bacterium]
MIQPHVIQAVRWSPDGDAVTIIDQRRLPGELVERELRSLDEVCDAIRTLAVRGAPAIGVAGAMGLVASLARHAEADDETAFNGRVAEHAAAIRGTRPTAVNLPWAIDRMLARIGTGGGKREAVRGKRELHPAGGPPHVGVCGAPGADAGSDRRDTGLSAASQPNLALLRALRDEADAILEEDRAMCRRIGEHGLPLIADGARVLTHCNAGALATAGIGTALAPVYLAVAAGRRVEVFADETRPLLQGSRLTAWELSRA